MSFRFFSFSMLIALGALLGHISLHRRLVRDTVRHRALRLLALAVLFLLTLLLLLRRTLTRHRTPELADGVAVMMYTWMGVALFLVLALGVLDLGRGLMAVGRGFPRAWTSSSPVTPRASTGTEPRTST